MVPVPCLASERTLFTETAAHPRRCDDVGPESVKEPLVKRQVGLVVIGQGQHLIDPAAEVLRERRRSEGEDLGAVDFTDGGRLRELLRVIRSTALNLLVVEGGLEGRAPTREGRLDVDLQGVGVA